MQDLVKMTSINRCSYHWTSIMYLHLSALFLFDCFSNKECEISLYKLYSFHFFVMDSKRNFYCLQKMLFLGFYSLIMFSSNSFKTQIFPVHSTFKCPFFQQRHASQDTDLYILSMLALKNTASTHCVLTFLVLKN